jgi:hypothetical protein
MGHYSDSYEADADRLNKQQAATNKAVLTRIKKHTSNIRKDMFRECDISQSDDQEKFFIYAEKSLTEFEFWIEKALK